MNKFGIHMNALRAFEAAARLKSFSKAAIELHVTHSTISHHIKGLENALGRPLFHRKHRHVELVKDAEKLSLTLNLSFDKIALELGALRVNHKPASLKVAVTPTFANKWLVPNLKHFRNKHPEIEVKIHPSLALVDLKQENFDIAIRTGKGNWEGLTAKKIMPIHMTPLYSPRMLDTSLNPIKLADIDQHTLIHADVSDGVGIISEWHEWAKAASLTTLNTNSGLSFNDPGIALQAAIDGLGIAMGYLELAQNDINSGKLIQPFNLTVRHPWSYYVVVPKGNLSNELATVFYDWLCSLTAKANQPN